MDSNQEECTPFLEQSEQNAIASTIDPSIIATSLQIQSKPEQKSSYFDFPIASNLLLNAIPCMIYIISNLAILAINLHFIGQTENAFMIDAVGLANAWANCIIFAAIMSLNTGLVAMGSQAYGSGNYRLLGIYYHRAIFSSLIVLSGGLFFVILSKQILPIFDVPQETVQYAYDYMIYSIGGYLAYAIYDTSRNYLMAQEDYAANLIIQIVAGFSHWYCCWYSTVVLNMGVKGIGFATSITLTLEMILLLGYMFLLTPNKESWFWFRTESFTNILGHLKYEISVGLMMYMDVVGYELLTIFASSYPADDLGGWVTAIMVIYLVASVPFGLGATLTPQVGSAVGLGDKALVKRTFWTGLIVNFVVISVAWSTLALFYVDIIGFLSKNKPINAVAEHICLVYLLIMPGDYTQFYIASYLKGIGKQVEGVKCFTIGYYLIGLPIAFILGNWVELRDTGLIIGIGVGSSLLLIGLLIVLSQTDIEKQIYEIKNRIDNDASNSNDLRNGKKIPEDDV